MSEQIKPKINRAERPDKAAFRTFIGAFLLIACIPFAVWSYWNYADYQQTTDGIRYLREHPEPIPTNRKEQEDIIARRTSMANRHRLEAILSGAGSLILLGGAIFLFTLAVKARRIKPQFASIDWRSIPLPTRRVEVQYKRIYDILFVFIILFFVGMMTLFFLANGLRLTSAIMLFLITSSLLPFVFLITRAKRQAARLFDASGITRGDGRQFAWNEFQGVITRIDINLTTRQKYVWRIELAFANGEKAWIIPNRIKNAGEVFTYVAALPRTVLKNSQ
jgi:hypothetical protein